MRTLFISMPDTMYLFRWGQAPMPNLAISSIAGNLDRTSFQVKLLDLVVKPYGVRSTVEELIRSYEPHVVGLSAMSFQGRSALRIAELTKSIDPGIRTILGGYHATLAHDAIEASGPGRAIDFLVRGEGEATARQLLEMIESGTSHFESIPGLSFRSEGAFIHNPARQLLDPAAIALPDREVRVLPYRPGWNGWIDSVETSRGCHMSCSFCSIRQMYGRSFRTFSIDRVIEDIRRVRSLGARRIFFADDNITLDVTRFQELCQAILDNGLNDLHYSTQASAVGIASSEDLVRLMRAANFTLVFLGIESVDEEKLRFMKKGRIADRSIRAIELLRTYGIPVAGGFITGLPDDKPEDVRRVFQFAREQHIAVPIVWCSTPYPRTQLREDLLREDLVVNKSDYSSYNGWYTNVRTRHMTRRRLSFERARGYFLLLFRAVVIGDNDYMQKARRASRLLVLRYRLLSIGLFARLLTGTWQSTHSTSFRSWWSAPLLPARLMWIRRRTYSPRRESPPRRPVTTSMSSRA